MKAFGWLVFALVLAFAAFLRFDRLGGPSYWLDEILADGLATKAAQSPWWHWITGLEREHGPLFYAGQLATRPLGQDEAAGRLPAAIFGLATVAVIPFVTRRRLVAAILLAANPFHVYYSREARPYALLMLLTAAFLLAVLHHHRRLALALLIAILYTTAVAAPLLIAIALTLALVREWMLAAAAALATALVPMIYQGPASPGATFGTFDASDIARVLQAHPTVIALLTAFALLGAVLLWRRDRRSATIVVGLTILPALLAIVSLVALNHWFATRYLSPSLIGFVVLAGEGIASVAAPHPALRATLSPLRGARESLAPLPAARGEGGLGPGEGLLPLLIALGFAIATTPAARRDPFEKLDWRAIGAALERHVQPRDYIVVADEWSSICLRYYVRHLPPGARIAGVADPRIAEMLTFDAPVWFVSAGYSADTRVRDFACRYPLVLASRLEELRVNYARPTHHFLREVATAEDLRAVAAGLGAHVVLRSGIDDELVRQEGWADGEGDFRWAASTNAVIGVPRLAPVRRRIAVHALPFLNPSLPPQTLRVSVNGTLVGATTMANEWRDYAFDTPAAAWREGLNLIAFSFDRANAPAQFGGSDRRTLAAAFQRIAIDDVGDATPPVPPLPSIHLASDTLVDARTAPPSAKTRFPHLNRAAAEQLLGRIGFDPVTVGPRLERGELHLEDVASAIAYESGCEDDRAFLDRAFAVIAGRKPNPGEQADLLARLRRKTSRAAVVERILRAQDVASRLTSDSRSPTPPPAAR